ncbi:hypothetical protein [Ruegeria sp. HKCCD4318-2]|uniref:hypothetical protein n=1 Tax=Ruegeria sp. HKCCD4318-2 TaxID=2683020 RepID=UPI0014922D0B|nr:hypothetical protein [Ruegeria sp. HKCCD4318-2]
MTSTFADKNADIGTTRSIRHSGLGADVRVIIASDRYADFADIRIFSPKDRS